MIDRIKWVILWIKDNFIGKVFYLTRVSAKNKPSECAHTYWSLWTSQVVSFIILNIWFFKSPYLIWGFWTLILAFLIGEAAGIGLKFKFFFGGPGTTYSEWVWWNVKNPYIRLIWGYVLSCFVMVYAHVLIGSLLAMWLTIHFALKGRELLNI